eukprot:scaffold227416_cov48-Attheya_sp.AAC.1
MKVIILPGNGCSPVRSSLWYTWLEGKLLEEGRFKDGVVLKDMPDPDRARRSIWLPFIKEQIMVSSERTIVVGHSSGAEAALRLAETIPLAGLVLVAACHTDLGVTNERLSGWYPPSGGEWKWDDIRSNSGNGNILLLHSTDDPFIPISEPRHVAKCLGEDGCELREFTDQSHFFYPSEDILHAVNHVLDTALLL